MNGEETIQGLPPEVIRQGLESYLSLPEVGVHEMGWRDPGTGQKERYQKKGGTVAAMLGYATMVLDTYGAQAFPEDEEKVFNDVGRLQRAIADRPDGLISDDQVELARQVASIGVALVDKDLERARSIWQQLQEKLRQR